MDFGACRRRGRNIRTIFPCKHVGALCASKARSFPTLPLIGTLLSGRRTLQSSAALCRFEFLKATSTRDCETSQLGAGPRLPGSLSLQIMLRSQNLSSSKQTFYRDASSGTWLRRWRQSFRGLSLVQAGESRHFVGLLLHQVQVGAENVNRLLLRQPETYDIRDNVNSTTAEYAGKTGKRLCVLSPQNGASWCTARPAHLGPAASPQGAYRGPRES